MKRKLYGFIMLLFAAVGCIFFSPETESRAAGCTPDIGQTVTAVVHVQMNDDVPDTIKQPIKKGQSLLTYIVRIIGWMMVAFGIVFLAISFFSHQTDQRIMGIIALIVGALVAFSPEIANWITGQ